MRTKVVFGLSLLLASLASPASAEPITDLMVLVGDGFELRRGPTVSLTAEDLALLAFFDDNGLHLGWFKQKLRDRNDASGALPDSVPTFPPVVWQPEPGAWFPPASGVRGLPGDPFVLPPGGLQAQTGPLGVAPEPGSLVLLGSGLIVLARRLRRSRR